MAESTVLIRRKTKVAYTNKVTSISLQRLYNGKIKAGMVATGVTFGFEIYNIEFDSIQEFATFIVKDWEYEYNTAPCVCDHLRSEHMPGDAGTKAFCKVCGCKDFNEEQG